MHSSTSGLRPRQRTFTSCTECRRRKQRCNQAKDRPCNNCARRYPPVACIYDSSTPATHDRILEYQTQPLTDTTYIQTTTDTASLPITTTSGHTYYPSSSSSANPYYAPPPSSALRPDYRSYPSDVSSSTITSGGYSTMDASGGYYYSEPIGGGYSTASGSSIAGGGYTTVDSTTQGDIYGYPDSGVVMDAGTDYYYQDPSSGSARR